MIDKIIAAVAAVAELGAKAIGIIAKSSDSSAAVQAAKDSKPSEFLTQKEVDAQQRRRDKMRSDK